MVKQIRRRYESKLPFIFVEEENPTGDFYHIIPKGINHEVVLNVSHPFYTRIYTPLKDEGVEIYLELVLMALARTEANCTLDPEKQRAFEWIKREMSTVLATYLQNPAMGEIEKSLE